MEWWPAGDARASSLNESGSKLPHSKARNPSSGGRLVESLAEIGDDVIDMLDAHAQPNHFRSNTDLLLFFRRQLAVSGGGRMTSQRLGIAHVDHSFEEAQGIEAFPAGFEAAFDAKGQQRATARAHIFLRHRVEWTVREPRVVYPLDSLMAAEEFRYSACIFHVALDAQRQRLYSL